MGGGGYAVIATQSLRPSPDSEMATNAFPSAPPHRGGVNLDVRLDRRRADYLPVCGPVVQHETRRFQSVSKAFPGHPYPEGNTEFRSPGSWKRFGNATS